MTPLVSGILLPFFFPKLSGFPLARTSISVPAVFQASCNPSNLAESFLQNGQHDPPVNPLVRTITVRACDTIGKWLLPGAEEGLQVRLGVPFNLRVRQEDTLG